MTTPSMKCRIGKTMPLMNIVQSYLLYTYQGDSEKYIPTYLKMAMDVYSDLNFNVLTSEVRKIYTIDKKLGTITLPDDMLYWAQISIIDDKDNVIPLLENDIKLLPYEEEVVAEAGCPNPNCQTDICSGVKSITAVTEVVVIDFPSPGTEYTNVTKTQIQPDGSIIKETCKWFYGYETLHDYNITYNHNTPRDFLYSIRINNRDYVINLLNSNISGIETALNALGLGTFVVTSVGANNLIESLGNVNIIQSIVVKSSVGVPYDFNFTQSNPENVPAVVQKCETEQLCKVELIDECIADTPENVAIVNETCLCVRPCDKVKKLLPTIHVNDGTVYFSNTNYDRVVLTYKTTGINFGMELMVPVVAEKAMISGLSFYALKHKKNVSISEKENARKYYNIDKKKLIEFLYPMRIQELMNAARVFRVIK
jgi:hypothetical protein